MIRRRFLAVAGTACAVALLGGCGSGDQSGPPDINYGRDVCVECHMIISEARFAAAFRDRGGEAFAFDDIGDMVAYAKRARIIQEVTAWVHDFDTESWIDALTATYVQGSNVLSPMGHNTVAFARRSEAEAFLAQHGGELLSWNALISQDSEAGAHDPGTHH